MSNKKSFYGIGHCIVDYFAPKTSEAVFSALNQKSPLHLEEKEFSEIFSQVKPSIKKTGGTTANILKTIGKLGEKCVFTGAAGSSDGKLDEDGEFFQEEMSKIGVECQLFSKDVSTGGFLWISKDDGERLIAVNVGAAKQLEASQINESRFSNSYCFIMEGMQFLNQHIVERVVDLSFRYNVPLVVDCGTLFGAEAVGKVLLDVSHSVDIILFANENEIQVLEKYIEKPWECCFAFVEKLGEKGAKLYFAGEEFFQEAAFSSEISNSSIIDDTGAGDAFAGGFLQSVFSDSEKTLLDLSFEDMKNAMKKGTEEAYKVLSDFGV